MKSKWNIWNTIDKSKEHRLLEYHGSAHTYNLIYELTIMKEAHS